MSDTYGVRMPDGQLNRQKTAKLVVVNYLNSEVDFTQFPTNRNRIVTTDDIYVVWFCKTLQNWKALLSTDVYGEIRIYFEVTFNGDKNELYLDVYRKWYNEAIKIREDEDAKE